MFCPASGGGAKAGGGGGNDAADAPLKACNVDEEEGMTEGKGS